MFGAVVCPRCRRGFAVDLEHRSSSCPHCGRQVQTRRMKAHFTSSSASLTAQAVAELNTKGRELRSFAGSLEQKERRGGVSVLQLERLVEELGDFDLSELQTKLDRGTSVEAEELLGRMRTLGLVYERSPGRYRKA